jgi:hypothetical protein
VYQVGWPIDAAIACNVFASFPQALRLPLAIHPDDNFLVHFRAGVIDYLVNFFSIQVAPFYFLCNPTLNLFVVVVCWYLSRNPL